jgi:hypothetical protein
MATIKEAFTTPSAAQSSFYTEQQIRFQEVEPNRFLPDNMKGNVGTNITNKTLSQFDKYDPYTETVSNRFTAAGLSQVLQGQSNTTEEEEYCRSFMGASSLPKLIADQDLEKNIPIRCGWRYKKSPGGGLPLVSQGALGTINGPLNPKQDVLGNGVEWIWNLRKALDRHARDYRRMLPSSAAGLSAAQAVFPNTAWCTQSQTFISVDRSGNPLPGFTCARENIVTNAANFPAARTTAASTLATTNANTVVSCMTPGVSPSLGRDCLLQAIRMNGCSTDGTLYQAIESAKPSASSYSTFLDRQPSFMTYQSKQGGNGITQELFNKERGSWDMATREIQKLQRFTQSAQDPSVRVAAQDLCLTAGLFDEYDFCADLTDSAPVDSVDLKCIQGYWQQQNGKPAGLLYPSRRPLRAELGTIRTWGDYRKAVDDLKAKTNSTNPIEQRNAINNFLGVSVSTVGFSPLNLDNIDNRFRIQSQPLVFWVDANDGSSLTIDGANRVQQWKDKSGRNNNVSQNSIINRPTYRREGFPSLEFNGSDNFLPIPNAAQLVAGNNFTVFVVERRKSDKNNNFFLGGTIGGRNNNLVLGYVINNLVRFAFFDNDRDGNVPPYQQSLEPARIWAFEKTPTGRAIILNGSRLSGDSNLEVLNGWTGGAIGRFGSIYYQGSIFEILIYNPGLSIGRREKVEGYLAHKWGLAGNLPAGHPFKVNPP